MRRGFTLMELLIVIGILAILAATILVAVNPNKQLNDARNASRMSGIVQIENATYQYIIDGNTLATVPNAKATAQDICRDHITAATCTQPPINGYDLSALAPKYIVNVPIDDQGTDTNLTGYRIYANGSIVKVCNRYLDKECGSSS